MHVVHKNTEIVLPARKLGSKLLETIGNTPLLRLERLPQELPGAELLAKAEWFNPGGSVKDRAAASIVRTGRSSVDSSPGSDCWTQPAADTGIAYAMIGAAEGLWSDIVPAEECLGGA